MDTLTIVVVVAFDLALLLGIASWAARGGRWRVLVGLAASALFGALFGVPVYAVATIIMRRRRGPA